MAPSEEIPLVPLVNNRTDPATDGYHGSQRTTTARALGVKSVAQRVDPMKELSEHIAHILYYNGHQPGDEGHAVLCSTLHRDSGVGPLLAQYEPCSQIDPEHLKAILAHLRPRVKTTGQAALVGLYDFVKTLLILRKAWVKAAGAFFGVLAYMDMCEKWGLYGGGPSFPGQHGSDLLQWQLSRTQERHETDYNTLRTFKSSPAFKQNIQQLFAYFERMKVEEQERHKRNDEAMKKAEEADKKRTAIKQHNERVISRQPGQQVDEMGDGLQQFMLEFMTHTMQRELSQTEDETENDH